MRKRFVWIPRKVQNLSSDCRCVGAGSVTTIAGGPNRTGHTDGEGGGASFSSDFDVAYLRSSCALLIADRGNRMIREIKLSKEDGRCPGAPVRKNSLAGSVMWINYIHENVRCLWLLWITQLLCSEQYYPSHLICVWCCRCKQLCSIALCLSIAIRYWGDSYGFGNMYVCIGWAFVHWNLIMYHLADTKGMVAMVRSRCTFIVGFCIGCSGGQATGEANTVLLLLGNLQNVSKGFRAFHTSLVMAPHNLHGANDFILLSWRLYSTLSG